VTIWGTGTPMREFLHVDDMAEASLFVLDLSRATYDANTQPMLSHINVGTGTDLTILDLAKLIAKTVGYPGEILTDPTKPDGTPKKLLDISLIESTGWHPEIPFETGLAGAYQDFLASLESGAARL
jgi:nucleoside-diphosphate-sugar epimerase